MNTFIMESSVVRPATNPYGRLERNSVVGYEGEHNARSLVVETTDDLSAYASVSLIIDDLDCGAMTKTTSGSKTVLSLTLTSAMIGASGRKLCQLLMVDSNNTVIAKSSQFVILIKRSNDIERSVEDGVSFIIISEAVTEMAQEAASAAAQSAAADVVAECQTIANTAAGSASAAAQSAAAAQAAAESIVVDATLDPTSTHAIQNKAVASEISSIKADLEAKYSQLSADLDVQIFDNWISGYYDLRAGTTSISIDAVTAGSNYVCQHQQCSPGDIFLYTGKGTSSARRYAFLSSDSGENNIITIASNATSEFSDFMVVAPENAQYVIFNSDNRVNHSIVKRRDVSFLNTNDDLNDFINEGSYYCNTAAIASTLSNLPEGMSPIGFNLNVKYLKQLNSGNVSVQTIILNSTGKPSVYIRTYLPSADPSWGNWTRLYQKGIDALLEIKNLSLITNNSDLDEVTNYGSYYCPNATSAKTIKNLPFFVDSGFSLYVVNTGSPDSESYIRQFIFANKGDLSSVYTRVKITSWGDWQLVVTSGSYEQPKVFKEGDILPQRTSDSVKKTIRVGTNNVAHYWVQGRNVSDGFDRYLADEPLRIARWRRWLLHANLDILFLQECEDYIDEGYEGHAKTMTAFDHIYKPFFDFDDNIETGASSRTGTNTDITSPSRRKVLNSLGMTYSSANKGVVSVIAVSDNSVLYFSWYIVSLENVGRILLVNCHNFAGDGTNYGRTTDRKKYLNEVSTFVLEKMQGDGSPDYFIICGDFNVRVSRSDLTTSEITSLDTTWQSNFGIDWQDDYESIVSFCNRINGIPANGGPIGWFTTVSQEESFPKPYDNIIVSNNIRIEDVDCDPVLVSSSYLYTDHTPVVAEISFLGELTADLEAKYSQLSADLGDKSHLETLDKTNIVSAINSLNGVMRTIANRDTSWASIRENVKSGYGEILYPVGTDFSVSCPSGAPYNNIVFTVVNHRVEGNEPIMTLLMKRCIYGIQFDAPQATFVASEAMAAGTYHFKLLDGYDAEYDGGKYVQFTLVNPLVAGDQIVITWGYNQSWIGKNAYVYHAFDATPAETCVMSEGQDGTYLGVADGSSANLNHTHRLRYGSDNWKESAVREWLNSYAQAGEWQTQQTRFQRPCSYASSKAGFISYLDPSFVATVRTGTHLNRTNQVFDLLGTKVAYSTDERFFLLSNEEIGFTSESGIVCGSLFSFYDGANNDDRIKYDIASENTARPWWLRTPLPSNADIERNVSGSGALSRYNAYTGYGAAAACEI